MKTKDLIAPIAALAVAAAVLFGVSAGLAGTAEKNEAADRKSVV